MGNEQILTMKMTKKKKRYICFFFTAIDTSKMPVRD